MHRVVSSRRSRFLARSRVRRRRRRRRRPCGRGRGARKFAQNLSGSAGLVALSSIIPSCSAFATVDSRYVLAESAALASSSADGRGSSSVVSKKICAGVVNDMIRVGPSVALASSSSSSSSSSRRRPRAPRSSSRRRSRRTSRRRLDPSRSGARVDAFEPVVRHTRARAVEDSHVVARARAAR